MALWWCLKSIEKCGRYLTDANGAAEDVATLDPVLRPRAIVDHAHRVRVRCMQTRLGPRMVWPELEVTINGTGVVR